MRRSILFFLLFTGLGSCLGTEIRFVVPQGQEIVSDDGTVQLQWVSTGDPDVPLQYQVLRSESSEFAGAVKIYEGGDTATYVSGMKEGDYYFRVKPSSENPDPSTARDAGSLLVHVRYIDNRLVALLMSAGLITFLAIVGTIFTGHQRTSGQEE